jgi:uncharacterized membrane protein YfcA
MELSAVKILIGGGTGLLHDRLGNVGLPLVASLPGGAIPGALAGSILGTRVPVLELRRILCTIRVAADARRPWMPAIH